VLVDKHCSSKKHFRLFLTGSYIFGVLVTARVPLQDSLSSFLLATGSSLLFTTPYSGTPEYSVLRTTEYSGA
jgi:hypothetical protein